MMQTEDDHLYFGHPSATQDINLDKYFISTKAYKEISTISDPRCIVVGKKGCGKTALFNRLVESKSETRLVTSINPDSHQLGTRLSYSYRQYSNLFQYEILLEALKTFTQNEQIRKTLGNAFYVKAIAAAKEYLQLLKGIKNKIGAINEIEIFGIGMSTEEEKDKVLRLASAQNADKLKDLISQITGKGIEILILIDDPDLLFGGITENSQSVEIVGGLLLATVALSSMKSRKLKVCTMVKQHKWELLSWQFEDFDKISQNVLVVSWEDAELEDLIIQRIKFRESLPHGANRLVCWGKAFEAKNENDIAGFKQYLYPRLTNGPRDLITFCNMAMRAARERKKSLISMEILIDMESEYSKDCLKEVGREFNGTYPGIVSMVMKLFDHPKLRNAKKIPRLVMEEAVSEQYRGPELQAQKKDRRWLAEAHGSLLIEILFKVGVIGFISKRDPNTPLMSYLPGSIDDSFQNATEFFVHPAYRKSLGISEI